MRIEYHKEIHMGGGGRRGVYRFEKVRRSDTTSVHQQQTVPSERSVVFGFGANQGLGKGKKRSDSGHWINDGITEQRCLGNLNRADVNNVIYWCHLEKIELKGASFSPFFFIAVCERIHYCVYLCS